MRAGLTEAAFPFLSRLSLAGRRELCALRAVRVAPLARVLEKGDPADGIYLVVGGGLRVFHLNARGREATLYHVSAGGTCILAITACYQGEPYPAWVDAGSKGASFVRVPGPLFRRCLDAEADFRHFVFAGLSGRIFELMSSLEEAQSAAIEQRVARFLVRRTTADGDAVKMTQAGMASEIGTAREVVFRALRALSAKGHIRKGRGHIEVLRREALRRVSVGPSA